MLDSLHLSGPSSRLEIDKTRARKDHRARAPSCSDVRRPTLPASPSLSLAARVRHPYSRSHGSSLSTVASGASCAALLVLPVLAALTLCGARLAQHGRATAISHSQSRSVSRLLMMFVLDHRRPPWAPSNVFRRSLLTSAELLGAIPLVAGDQGVRLRGHVEVSAAGLALIFWIEPQRQAGCSQTASC